MPPKIWNQNRTKPPTAKERTDFIENHLKPLIASDQDGLTRVLERVFHPDTKHGREILKTYRQNPLLEVLLRNLDRDK